MTVPSKCSTNMAHVNMMTDTIIANLPPDGLRVIMRSLLASHPSITASFEHATRVFLSQADIHSSKTHFETLDVGGLAQAQRTIRCMLGSGQAMESIPLLSKMVLRGFQLALESEKEKDSNTALMSLLTSLDGDIVQAMTAVKKNLFVSSGARALTSEEQEVVQNLLATFTECQQGLKSTGIEFPYSRALLTTANILGVSVPISQESFPNRQSLDFPQPLQAKETFLLGDRELPRLFSGLWQMSSSAWGSAQMSKIVEGFANLVNNGFTAFDMADHYGDAEVVYGGFRDSYTHKDRMFTATKYCVFHQMTVTQEAVQENISERCQRLQQDVIDLLQFHWQFWDNPQYIDALRYLALDQRVTHIGLCNFDTQHLETVVQNGVNVYTNQVQFSLVDSRPTFKMAESCMSHDIKLLTYGTLCGGFIADKWLGKPEPAVYETSITPSQRKYYGMIHCWGGWGLFQELLTVLRTIATKHKVNISNVATRWVLDFPYVGAVIIGARIGTSEHSSDNATTLGWSLDDHDRETIESVLSRSNRAEMFETMGDCGNEYR